MTIVVKINDRQVDELVVKSPKIFNTEFNRGFTQTTTDFFRVFTRARLSGKTGIRVRRKVAKKPGRRGKISIPAKARAFGFSASLRNRKTLDRKQSLMRNSSPVAISHEDGAVIRPKRGKYLFVRVKSVAAARRAGVNVKRGNKPKLLRVRSVTLKPRLKFIATWNAYVATARSRLFKTLQRARDRSIVAANKIRRAA